MISERFRTTRCLEIHWKPCIGPKTGGGHISQQMDWMDRAWRGRAGRVCASLWQGRNRHATRLSRNPGDVISGERHCDTARGTGPGNSIQLAQAVSAGNAATPLAAMGQTRVLESRDGTCCHRVLFWRNRARMLPIFAFAALEAFRAL